MTLFNFSLFRLLFYCCIFFPLKVRLYLGLVPITSTNQRKYRWPSGAGYTTHSTGEQRWKITTWRLAFVAYEPIFLAFKIFVTNFELTGFWYYLYVASPVLVTIFNTCKIYFDFVVLHTTCVYLFTGCDKLWCWSSVHGSGLE